ncbi:unnamed protein product, partial [Prorocentrum cordatum]
MKAQNLFGNITEWEPQAANFCRTIGHKYPLIALAETHVDANGIHDQIGKLAMDDWKLAATPALPTYKSGKETHGGEWILTQGDIAATTFEGHREHDPKAHNKQEFAGFSRTTLHTKSGNIVVVAAYLRPGLRDRGANRGIMVSISTFMNMLTDPWVILADWTYEPNWWDDRLWPTKRNGTALTNPECKATCDKGKGSAHDYAIVRADFATHLDIKAMRDVPWNTHWGIQVTAGRAEPRAHKAIREDPAPFIAPEADWGEAAAEARNYPRSQGTRVGTKEGRDHIFHSHKQKAAARMNSAYAQRVATIEIAPLETHHAPADERASTLILRYTALVKNAKDPKARQQIHGTILSKLDDLDNPEAQRNHSGTKTDPKEIDEWKTHISTLEFCDEGDLQYLCATAAVWTHTAMARAAGRARKRYPEWAKLAWKDPPSKLHRTVADPKMHRLDDKMARTTVGDPYLVMSKAADTWRDIWKSDRYNEEQIIDAHERAIMLAKEDPLPIIEPQHIQAVIGVANPMKSRGVDNTGPIDI